MTKNRAILLTHLGCLTLLLIVGGSSSAQEIRRPVAAIITFSYSSNQYYLL
jgi:hypothetical protein